MKNFSLNSQKLFPEGKNVNLNNRINLIILEMYELLFVLHVFVTNNKCIKIKIKKAEFLSNTMMEKKRKKYSFTVPT